MDWSTFRRHPTFGHRDDLRNYQPTYSGA
ncbi:hypothetical protein CCACVL1_02387 [Corchorus capsularis]|uniref:Uncharacterized protein n=1 Tax=Corchorus capsularis TaxID=210143 RepID=A0A1R3K8Y2_COCAP|nr:hypothetical protein CCACVL1_02387 [Corchorus capsularis]